jgi:uncharacterized membrane protein YhaH (DUF805 family)
MRASLDPLCTLVTLALACGLVSTARAFDVQIADQTIAIPTPAGFSEISRISPETFRTFQAILPARSPLLAVFVSEADTGRLLRGEPAVLDQYMLVQSSGAVEKYTFTQSQFAEFRAGLRKQYEAMDTRSESLDAALKKAGETWSNKAGTEIGVAMNGGVFLGIDSETATTISASILTKYTISAGSQHIEQVMAGVSGTLLVKGKILNANVYRSYSGKDDLTRTREQSQSWIKSILAANETTWPAASGRIVPQGTLVTSTTKELLSGEWAEYSLKSHPKAEGLNVSLKYPKSWNAREGIRPHIVQKFTGPIEGGLSPSCMVIVQSMPTWAGLLLQGQIAAETLKENLKEMIPNGATFLDAGQSKLDGEPCAWVKYSHGSERAGVQVRMYCLQYMLFYRGNVLAIECGVGGVADDPVLRDAFTSYLPVFQMIGNSIVIHDKWSADSSPALKDLRQDRFGQYWVLTIGVSLILTWGIGLLPPLLIRFAIVRQPISKWPAVIIVAVFFFVNVAIFTTLGSQSKTHGALMLVAFASYVILHRGHEPRLRDTSTEEPWTPSASFQIDVSTRKGIDASGNSPEIRDAPSRKGDEKYTPPAEVAPKQPEAHVDGEATSILSAEPTSPAVLPADEVSAQAPTLAPPVRPMASEDRETRGTADTPSLQSPPSIEDETSMPAEIRAKQVRGTPVGDHALHEPDRMAGRQSDVLVDMCHALTAPPICQPPNRDHAARESGHSVVESSCEPPYGGIGRLTYAMGVFALSVVYACWRAASGDNPNSFWVASILALVVLLFLMVARLHNIGMSGWWAILLFIPLAGLFVMIPCLVYPAGYSYTKKLDAAAKILICLLICLLVLVVIALLSNV